MNKPEKLATSGTQDTGRMDNPEKLATLGTQDTGRMGNPEKLATLGTQDTGRRQAKQNIHHYAQTNTNNINNVRFLFKIKSYMAKSSLLLNDE
jgi:hypothetical protein